LWCSKLRTQLTNPNFHVNLLPPCYCRCHALFLFLFKHWDKSYLLMTDKVKCPCMQSRDDLNSSNSVHTSNITYFQGLARQQCVFPQEYVNSYFILQGLNSHRKYKSLSKWNTSVVHEFQGALTNKRSAFCEHPVFCSIKGCHSERRLNLGLTLIY